MPGSEVTSAATVNSRRTHNARRRFVAATLIDAVGSGLWMPFALLFLVHAQRMSLTEAGAALSLGALLGLAAGPGSGALMDRVGPVTVLVASNVIRLAAFACYPLVSSMWQVVLVATVVSVGDRLFWTANAPFVDALTVGRDSETLLGTQTIGRFLGAGMGAGTTALMPSFSSAATYHVLAYLNAASFAVAGLLIMGLRAPVQPRARATETDNRVGWAVVLRDRAYLGLCASHVLFTIASVGKYSLLPILVLDVLHGPQWVPGISMAIGAVVLVTTQRRVIRLAARWSRAAGLITSALVFACSFAVLVPTTVLPLPVSIAVILTVSTTVAVAEALFAPLATAAAAAAAPVGSQGRASALFQLSWAVSTVVGPALLTGLLAIGNAALWLVLTATSALAVPAVLVLRRTLPAGVLAG